MLKHNKLFFRILEEKCTKPYMYIHVHITMYMLHVAVFKVSA